MSGTQISLGEVGTRRTIRYETRAFMTHESRETERDVPRGARAERGGSGTRAAVAWHPRLSPSPGMCRAGPHKRQAKAQGERDGKGRCGRERMRRSHKLAARKLAAQELSYVQLSSGAVYGGR